MALAMWAKSAAGTNLVFIKGLGKALKSCREVFQQAVLKKPAPKPKAQKTLEVSRIEAKDRCLFPPNFQFRGTTKLQSRIFKSLFSRTTSKSLASELRRRSALQLSSGSVRSFRHVPIMSLIGVTLGLDVTSLIDDSAEKMMSEMREIFRGYTWQTEPLEKLPQSLDDLDINLESIANGCEGVVFKAKVKANEGPLLEACNSSPTMTGVSSKDAEYDLAVKAVFNYEAESNFNSIFRALEREIVPLRADKYPVDPVLGPRVNRLPAHPNIVDMPGLFVDDMLVTEECLRRFPAAMPRRLNPDMCYGRNKTLYLVMRRRSTHLRDYLATHKIDLETRCLMLAQLLEGVAHLRQHGIAHRDLKSDNVLVDVSENGGAPRLEICDFGCCLAENNKSLLVPFPSRDLFLGGNSWLMAPEISTAVPGPSAVLDFRKSDLWAAGTMAYEIMGMENPFYPSKDNSYKQLSSRNYSEDELPSLPDEVPGPVRRLVKALLSRNTNKRPSASAAAAVVQMVVLEASLAHKQNVEEKRKSRLEKKRGHNRKMNFFSKEKQKLNWLIVQSLSLLCQLTFQNHSQHWDVMSIMNFLLLSHLTHADFKEAMKFF